MRVEMERYGLTGVKACLVKSDGSVEMWLKNGRKWSEWGIESVIDYERPLSRLSEGDRVEKIELANGNVMYRVMEV